MPSTTRLVKHPRPPGGPASLRRPSTAAPKRQLGALAGVLSGAGAMAAAEVTGRLVPGGSGPVVAVGNRVVALAPPSARDAGISAVGTLDKPLLVVGIVLVVALLAMRVGVLAQTRPRAAELAVGVLGAVALAAQLPEPGGSLLGSLSVALVTVLVGVLLLRALTTTRTGEPAVGVDRRHFLLRSAAVTAGVVAGGGLIRFLDVRAEVGAVRDALRLPALLRRAPGNLAAADLGVEGVTPVLTPSASFYRIDTALTVPQVDPRGWSLGVEGMVRTPLRLTYEDLLALPQVEADITIQCVSNEVGGGLVGTARWQGVLLRDVLARAGVQPGAGQVVGESVDGFTAGFPLSYATDDRFSLIALGMNGEPLPVDHGFPARLIVPGLYGYVSATKWLSRIRVTTWEGFDGFWVPRGWSKEGPIKIASRIDVPAQAASVPAGDVVVGGMAWAPGRRRGITAVEVRVDEGPWRMAELGGALSEDTWRQWRWTWAATPGVHLLEVRARDRTGAVQTGQVRDIRPDGATGYHGVEVQVT